MWCGRKGIDCPDCGVFGECQRSACGLPNIETSTLGTSSSYLVNTISEEFITDIKREAVKEFADRLKETITNAIDTYYNSYGGGYYLAENTIDEIDELLKEYEVEE